LNRKARKALPPDWSSGFAGENFKIKIHLLNEPEEFPFLGVLE
jgi:hypothetical protein